MREWIKLVETMGGGPRTHQVNEAAPSRGIYLCPHCSSRMPLKHLEDRCPVCHKRAEASGVNESVAPSTPAPASETSVAPLPGAPKRILAGPDDADRRGSFLRLRELAQFKKPAPVAPKPKRAKRKAL